MAKKKKFKQPGLMEGSEAAKVDVDPVMSEKPQSDLSSASIVTTTTKHVKAGKHSKPGSENGPSTLQQIGLSEDADRELISSSAKNALKQLLEKPSTSSFVRNPAAGQNKEAVSTEPWVIEAGGTKTHVPKRTGHGDNDKSAGGKKKPVGIKEDFTGAHSGRKKMGDGDQRKSSKKPVIFEDLCEIQGQKKAPSSRKGKQKKETAISRMEQKMNMRKKKIKDPRLIPRMREYLESRANKNFVSIPLMVEYLQHKYPEYGRKKKGMFFQYVDKAYSYMEKPGNNDPPPPLSDADENSNTEKELVEENGHYVWKNVSEHSRESDMDEAGEAGGFDATMDNNSDMSSDEGEDVEQLVEYKDSNAINNRLMSMYRNSPTHVSKSSADDKKRRAPETPDKNTKKCKSETKVLCPSPNVLEGSISSTGLVGPRRMANDKYFIDRKGNNTASKKDKPESKESREVTIQKFLGNLPSRASFSAYVPGKNDPRLKGGTLYRMFSGKSEDDEQHASLSHSGITLDNTGVTNRSPTSPSLLESEDMESSMITDPRRKGAGDVVENDFDAGKAKPSHVDTFRKDKAVRTPRKKKGGAKAKKQDDDDSESNKREIGFAVQKSTVTFADVGGNDASLTDICKLLVHMRHPEVYQQLGVTPPRGFLLHGPPGCGKTLLANAIAGELDLPLIKLAATEIVSGVSGDSEERIRILFDNAMQSAPCVMFIDEIDAITPKRETASKDMERRIVAQLLACMDDLNANPSCQVLVIGATNRPDALDPALRRAGRFDREICLGIPDEQSRLRIMLVLCRNLRLSSDFDFSYMARNTPGYVGADLMALAREAAMTAVNRVFQDLQSGTSNTTVDDQWVCGTSELNTLSTNSNTGLEVNRQNSINQNITGQQDSRSIVAENGTNADVMQLGTSSSLDQSCTDVSQLGTSLNVAHPGSTANVQLGFNSDMHHSTTSLNIDKPEPSLNVDEPGSSSSSVDNVLHWANKSNNTPIKILETNETILHNVNGCDGKDRITTEESNNAQGNTSDVNGESETRNANDNTNNVKHDTNNVKDDTNNVKDDINNVDSETSTANGVTDFVARTKDKLGVLSDGAKDAAEQDIAAQSAVVNAEIGATSMELDSEHIGIGKDNSKDNQEVSHQQITASVRKSEYISVLSWLKDHPPLTEAQLADLYITMDDFKAALKCVQPSAQREGFATIPDVTWDDIGALHEVREELQLAILAPVRHPELFKSLGLTRAQGVLLAGPPGCGKTLLAKAVANESGINFISVKGPELLNMYVGESERAVRTVFQRARNSAPCVIFFDELDALCPRRSSHSEGNSSARVVNQLLTEMDGLEERKQVFIMAATNRPDIIDPAVLRPGRLDKTLYVGLPTMSDRLDILTCITKNGTKPKLGDDVKLARVAEDSRCNCFSGADLAALVREASINALKEAISCTGRQPSDIIVVKGDHFDSAFRNIRPSVTPKDQERYDSIRSRLVIG